MASSGHAAFKGRQIFCSPRHSDNKCSLLSERVQFLDTSTLLLFWSHSSWLLSSWTGFVLLDIIKLVISTMVISTMPQEVLHRIVISICVFVLTLSMSCLTWYLFFLDLILCICFNCVYLLESPKSDGAHGNHRAVGPMGPSARTAGSGRRAGGGPDGERKPRKALAMPARPASFPEAWQRLLFALKKKNKGKNIRNCKHLQPI